MKYFCFIGIFDWDSKKMELIFLKNNYFRWNTYLVITFGKLFPLFYTHHLLSKWSEMGSITTMASSPVQFATYILGWCENTLVVLVVLLAHRMQAYIPNVIYLMNQMFRYTEVIHKKIRFPELSHLRQHHFQAVQREEYLILFANIISSLVPLAVGFALLYMKAGPSHQMFEETFEIELTFEWRWLPLALFYIWGASTISSIIFFLITIFLCNIWFTKSILVYLTPNQGFIHSNHSKISTHLFGLLDIQTITHMFKVQQIFNILMNQITGSITFSLHHVICLFLFTGLTFIMVAVPNLMLHLGWAITSLILFASVVPLFVEFMESILLGEVLDISNKFVDRCKRLMFNGSHNRRCGSEKAYYAVLLFKKFTRAFRPIKVQTAYPFFTMTRNTFPEFFYQSVTLIITLLSF